MPGERRCFPTGRDWFDASEKQTSVADKAVDGRSLYVKFTEM